MEKQLHFKRCFVFLSFALFIFISVPGFSQLIPDINFNPLDTGNGYGDGPNGSINSIVTQTDSKIILFGNFTRYNGKIRKNAVRLFGISPGPAAPVDHSFNASFGGGVPLKAVIQPDGKIIVVGSFTDCNSVTTKRIVRLNSNGSVDLAFNANIANGPDAVVNDLKLMGDGSIYIAGNFKFYNGFNRASVVKLNSDGSLNSTFNAGSGGVGAGGIVTSIEVGPNQSFFFVGGQFNNIFNGITGPKALVRLTAQGNVDISVIPTNITGIINDIKILPGNSSIVVGGLFSISGNTPISNLARFDFSTNSFFTGFNAQVPASDAIRQILVSGSNLVVVGNFTSINTSPRGRIARINNLSSGGLDPIFANGYGANDQITCIAPESNGGFVVGGNFRKFDNTSRAFAARISANGLVSNPLTLNSGVDRSAHALAIQKDNRILVGGEFGYFNSNFRNGITRLLENGNVDASFNPLNGVDGSIHAIAVQPDGRILAGGKFSIFNDASKNGLVRLLPNGNPDNGFFTSGTNDSVLCIAVQPDGKILVGGNFFTFGGQANAGLVRLLQDGSIDNTFNIGTGFNGPVRCIQLYKDSLIYVGGDFSSFNNIPRKGIVCLKPSGVFQSSLNIGPGINQGGRVRSIFVTHRREVFAAGLFSQYNGLIYKNIVKTSIIGNPDTSFKPGENVDGEVYDILVDSARRSINLVGRIGGVKAGVGRGGVIRLKPRGSKDLTIGNGVGGNGPVFSLERDTSGNLIIVGDFTKFDSVGKNRIMRLLDNPLELTIWNGADWDYGDPDCNFDALIVGNYQIAGFNCRNLTVLAGKKFFPTSRVEVCGNAYCYTSRISGEIYLTGDTLQEVEGTFADLSLDNSFGAKITYPTELLGTLKLWAGNFETSDKLVLKSSSTGTARIAKIESAASISGKLSMQRYVAGGTASWHLMGTPIKKQTQNDWADDFLILPNFMYLHNEAGSLNIDDQVNGWEQTTDSIRVGKGYRVFLNQPFFNAQPVFENQGEIISGLYSFDISFTPTGFGGGGWNLISNPYPCELDWHGFTRSQVDAQVHFWNVDQYASYSSGSGIGVNGAGRYISSSQAFFIKASAAGAGLSIDEDTKPLTNQNPLFLRTAVSNSEDIARITLRGSGNEADETAIRWMPEANPYFETEFDADKITNPGLNLFSLCSEGRKSSIQARNFLQADSVDLGYKVNSAGTFFLEIRLGAQLFDGKTWKLRDNESGFSFNVGSEMLFPFTVSEDALSSNSRFTLLGYSPAVQYSGIIKNSGPEIIPNPSSGVFQIHGLKDKTTFFIEDLSGRKILEGIFENGPSQKLDLNSLEDGVYVIRFKNPLSSISARRIVVRR